MEFHLEEWGDGTIRLTHWDAHHGHDVIFILGESGTATVSSVIEDGIKSSPDVDLVLELRKLIAGQ